MRRDDVVERRPSSIEYAGQVVAPARHVGRYELLSELGRGGMAELYVGRLRGVGGFSKLVAIKRMLPHLSQDPKFVELFLDEGRIAARMSHGNLCQVFELGEADGELFLAMEYLDGVTWETLSRALPDDPAVVVRATAAVIAQACEGMHYAHELRERDGSPTPVVHRDISPQNLFVTSEGTCKILDFGVAKVVTEVSKTRTGIVKGKLPYMSPEQIRGEALDGRSDVFALGVVLWEGLTRKPLFMRETEFLIWKAILDEPIQTVTSAAPQLLASVNDVVMRALARDREERTPSARELGHQVRAMAESWGGPMTPLELADAVRTYCASELAARASQLSEMMTGATARASVSPARADITPTVERPSRAASTRVQLRDRSEVLGATPRRTRRSIVYALAGVIALGIVAWVLVSSRHEDSRARGNETVARDQVPVDATATPTAPVDGALVDTAAPDAALPDARSTALVEPPPRTNKERVRSTPSSTSRPSPTTAKVREAPGTLSLDVKPSARVYLDGAFVDETPLFQHPVSAGAHELRLVRPDGSSKVIPIRISPGKPLNMQTVSW